MLCFLCMSTEYFSLLQVLGGQLVRLGETVFVACDAFLGFVLETSLMVHHLASISTVVHHTEKGSALESLFHKASVLCLGISYLSEHLFVNAFHYQSNY